ncbi:putative AC transposase [Nymphaea thermarum]|nr:putative AC transposase [Nymphaea thermarum]
MRVGFLVLCSLHILLSHAAVVFSPAFEILSGSHLDKYLIDPLKEITTTAEFNILSWWKTNKSKYKILAKMARDVLAISVSTVASKSAFNTSGRILNDYRCSMTLENVESLICTQSWIRDASNLCERVTDTKERVALGFAGEADRVQTRTRTRGVREPDVRALLPRLSLFSLAYRLGVHDRCREEGDDGGWSGDDDGSGGGGGGDGGCVGKLPLPPSLSASSPPSHAASPSFDSTSSPFLAARSPLLLLSLATLFPLSASSLPHDPSPHSPTDSLFSPMHRARPVDLEFVARRVLKSFVSAPQVLADPGQQVEQMSSLTSYWGDFGFCLVSARFERKRKNRCTLSKADVADLAKRAGLGLIFGGPARYPARPGNINGPGPGGVLDLKTTNFKSAVI